MSSANAVSLAVRDRVAATVFEVAATSANSVTGPWTGAPSPADADRGQRREDPRRHHGLGEGPDERVQAVSGLVAERRPWAEAGLVGAELDGRLEVPAGVGRLVRVARHEQAALGQSI